MAVERFTFNLQFSFCIYEFYTTILFSMQIDTGKKYNQLNMYFFNLTELYILQFVRNSACHINKNCDEFEIAFFTSC